MLAQPPSAPSQGERVVIVGTGETAAVAFEYFSHDSPHQVVAFSTEAQFRTASTWCGLPVVPLEDIATAYPPVSYRAFVAVSFTQLNRLRRRLYRQVKAVGFECVSYVSSDATVLPSARIGENSYVQEHVALQSRCSLGDNVFIGSGSCIGHSAVIGDNCFAGPHATVCGLARVGSGTFLGANCCIADDLSIAEDCAIGAGSVVVRDTMPGRVYMGNPARALPRGSLETFGVQVGPDVAPQHALAA